MTLKGKVIVDAKYEKVEIRDGGIAVVTDITGKTQTIHLKWSTIWEWNAIKEEIKFIAFLVF